jgi:hypothetical protein
VIDDWRDELQKRLTEARARTMIRVVNRSFKKHPSRLDRVARKLVAKAAGTGD